MRDSAGYALGCSPTARGTLANPVLYLFFISDFLLLFLPVTFFAMHSVGC